MKGHPILGVTTGFFFGLFLGVSLFLFGVVPLAGDLLWILPLLGILLGLIMAAWAPFGKGPRSTTKPPATAAPVPPPPPADGNETGEMEISGAGDDEADETTAG